jgi:hypothetical protein
MSVAYVAINVKHVPRKEDRQGQKVLNIGKAFVNTRRMNSAKFGCEAHFMSFAAIIASRNGTEGSNYHI